MDMDGSKHPSTHAHPGFQAPLVEDAFFSPVFVFGIIIKYYMIVVMCSKIFYLFCQSVFCARYHNAFITVAL